MEKNCDNGDPNFNKVLVKLFGNSSPETRKWAYFNICIWVRLILFIIVMMTIAKYDAIVYIIMILSFVASLQLLITIVNGDDKQQWWSKKYQFILAILVFILCLLSILYKTQVCTRYLVVVALFASLLGGLFQNNFVEFC